jgi:hypothetical protein
MKVITVGRNPANNVVINDPLVSKNHCQIIQDDYGNFSLVDNNSTNGTFVNGQRRQGEMRLNSSDIVRIGNTTLPWRSYFAVQETETDVNYNIDDYETINPPAVETSVPAPVKKQRHGFVTFWLWLGIIGSILSPIMLAFAYVAFESQISHLRYQEGFVQIAGTVNSISSTFLTMVICGIISAIVSLICYSFILKWRKFGFWGLVGSSLVFGAVNLFLINKLGDSFRELGSYYDSTQQTVISAVGFLFGTFVLWAILQIRKNGVSCWDNLE